jgi:hypothetical protein
MQRQSISHSYGRGQIMRVDSSLGRDHYNQARTHLSVNKDATSPRTIHAVDRIVPTPFLGGLHHQYVRF